MIFESNAIQVAPCPTHGALGFVFVSPKIAHATKSKKPLYESEILILKVESSNQIFEYYVDSDFLKEFITLDNRKEFYLKDRDKEKKEMNDRLTIQKIVKKLLAACPKCMVNLLVKEE